MRSWEWESTIDCPRNETFSFRKNKKYIHIYIRYWQTNLMTRNLWLTNISSNFPNIPFLCPCFPRYLYSPQISTLFKYDLAQHFTLIKSLITKMSQLVHNCPHPSVKLIFAQIRMNVQDIYHTFQWWLNLLTCVRFLVCLFVCRLVGLHKNY